MRIKVQTEKDYRYYAHVRRLRSPSVVCIMLIP
jgi:hypothetical protein